MSPQNPLHQLSSTLIRGLRVWISEHRVSRADHANADLPKNLSDLKSQALRELKTMHESSAHPKSSRGGVQ